MCMVFALNGKDSSLRDKTRCIMILNSSDMSDSEYIGLILQLLTLEKVKKGLSWQDNREYISPDTCKAG